MRHRLWRHTSWDIQASPIFTWPNQANSAFNTRKAPQKIAVITQQHIETKIFSLGKYPAIIFSRMGVHIGFDPAFYIHAVFNRSIDEKRHYKPVM